MKRTAIVVAVALAAVACGGADEPVEGDGLSIVATTTIWADVASSIVGSEGSVESLIPVGVDPHAFSPSPSQVAGLVGADLVIANGLGLEAGFKDVLAAAEDAGAVVVTVGDFADPLGFDTAGEACEPADHDDHGVEPADEHDHGTGCDPHVWMDPERVALAVGAIAEALASIAPDVDWAGAATGYESELNALTAEMAEILDAVPVDRQVLVTNHDSLRYLAERFGYSVIETVIPGGSTLGNPSSAALAQLVETMRDLEIRAIFADTTDSTALAEAVAAELGGSVTVVELYTGSIGPEGSGADSLIGMLRVDAELIAGALE